MKDRFTKEFIIALVTKGDCLEIVPINNLPNLPKKIKVDEVRADGFLYGLSASCDGFIYPFWAIKSLKIVKKD